MGVCDYTCFCHTLEEGEQCLNIHQDCSYDINDELEEVNDYTDQLLSERITNEHTGDGTSANKAHLLIFSFKDELPGTADEVLEFIRAKKQISVMRFKDRYSWDAWDFERYEGYIDVLTSEDNRNNGKYSYSIWRLHEFSPIIRWIINLCPTCFKLLTLDLDAPYIEGLCSKLIRDIANKFQIDIEGIESKKEAITRIRQYFSFLPLNQ